MHNAAFLWCKILPLRQNAGVCCKTSLFKTSLFCLAENFQLLKREFLWNCAMHNRIEDGGKARRKNYLKKRTDVSKVRKNFCEFIFQKSLPFLSLKVLEGCVLYGYIQRSDLECFGSLALFFKMGASREFFSSKWV